MSLMDEYYLEKYGLIAGTDEAGRGPLCGPVFSAAVFIDNKKDLKILEKYAYDSKSISEKKRFEYYDFLIKNFDYVSGFADSEEIDMLNIFKATEYSMKKIFEGRDLKNSIVLADGKNFKFNFNYECIIKGDSKLAVIGAASIIAKCERDSYMKELSGKYPWFNLQKHKGYPTKEHLALIRDKKIISEYRLTYSPVKEVIKNGISWIDKNEFSKERLFRAGIL